MQWWCERDERGALRPQPLNPSLASDDCIDKATMFMEWVSRNAPGWTHRRKNSEAMVG